MRSVSRGGSGQGQGGAAAECSGESEWRSHCRAGGWPGAGVRRATVVHTGERLAGQGGAQRGAFQQRVYASGVSFTQSVSRTQPHSCLWASVPQVCMGWKIPRGVSRFGDSLSLIQVDGSTELSPVGEGPCCGGPPFLTGLEKQLQGHRPALPRSSPRVRATWKC